ncbi:MAG TPA: hypothetical protein VGD59_11130 [Acidisarcina sp.]
MKNPASPWAVSFVALVSAAVLFYRFRYPAGFLAFYEDDFFYYLKVAASLVTAGRSTFDGTHLTNGYHPLWMLTLTALYRLAPGKTFFVALEALTLASVLTVFYLTRQCLLLRTRNTLYIDICSVIVAMFSLTLMRGGMEVTLTLPLALGLLLYRLRPGFVWSTRQTLIIGLLASLVVLSRLDSGILVALIFLCDAVYERLPLPALARRAALYASGASLIGVYLVINKLVFGSLLPVSAQAKELRHHHLPAMTAIRSIAFPLAPGKLVIVVPSALVLLGLLVTLISPRRTPQLSRERPVLWALTIFPVLHILILSMVSDWQLWLWYFYPFVLLLFAGSLAWAHRAPRDPDAASPLWKAAAAVLCLFWIAYSLRSGAMRRPEANEIYPASRELETFASTHPGRYAMGDRSGLPGFLIRSPMIQLEGLMMDEQYLNYVRRQTALTDVFKVYGVRYYIATSPQLSAGCYRVSEPAQAGPDSARMKGTLCLQPLAQWTNSAVITSVFDLQQARPATDPATARAINPATDPK